MLVLLFVAFVVYSTRRFVLSLAYCHFVLVFFCPLSIAITSLAEESIGTRVMDFFFFFFFFKLWWHITDI